MPTSGTSTSATARAARRNVPSPPSTTSASVPSSACTRLSWSPASTAQAAIPCAAHQAKARADSATASSLVGLKANPIRRTGPPVMASPAPRSGRGAHRGSAPPGRAPGTRAARPDLDRRTAAPSSPGASANRKNSRLPAGPSRGEAQRSSGRSPSAQGLLDHALEHDPMDGRVTTTPPGTSPRPASNCGFTRATMCPPGSRQAAIGPSTRPREMNETSTTARAARSPSTAGSRWRALTRSWTTTRRSAASAAASWPRPTSTAWTRAAPRWSRASVKPPVDAPASRQTRPRGSTPNASSAPASFSPPRET